VSSKGNHAGVAKLPVEATFQQWLFLSRVEVSSATAPGTVVTFGDSITDGTGSTPDTNSRWPDFLARRLGERYGAAAPGVINAGIGGNRVLSHNAGAALLKRAGVAGANAQMDDPNALFGPSGVSRFDQDVLLQPGVTHVIVLETINDIGMSTDPASPTVEDLISGHRTLIQRAHAQGLKIYGATLTPFKGAFYWTESGEARRQKLNEWIRTSGEYDGVVDFDAAMRDPKDPLKIRENFQPGDWLHANDAGYKAMADAVDLTLFATTSGGSSRRR
jgi:lysophospholipase L1-like esterase